MEYFNVKVRFSNELSRIFMEASVMCKELGSSYITLEAVMAVICKSDRFRFVASELLNMDLDMLYGQLVEYIKSNKISTVDSNVKYSTQLTEAMTLCLIALNKMRVDIVELEHVLAGMLVSTDSYADYYLCKSFVDAGNMEIMELLQALAGTSVCGRDILSEVNYIIDISSDVELKSISEEIISADIRDAEIGKGISNESVRGKSKWKELVTCLNDNVSKKKIIGREKEIERTIEVLARESKNNPVHVGEAGVGKTKIVEGIVQKIESGEVPNCMKGYKIYQVDMAGLVAGTKYRGDFEKKLKTVLDNAEKEDKCILYMDELHTISGAGNVGGAMDASNILKPYLTRGKLKVIGATTYKEYKNYIENDSALNRRFQKIDVTEPSRDDTIKIIKGLRDYYEDYHKVVYTDDALESAVDLSIKYINDRMLPDKAIDIIDESGAYIKVHEIDKNIVDKGLVEKIVSRIGNVPIDSVQETEIDKLRNLEDNLNKRVVGQEQATKGLVNSIKMSRAGLGDSSKPIASVLFVGPTGVGKTEMAKALADQMGMKLIRFDMSEYMDKTSANKLIGSSAGYVGYEDGGLLVDAVRKTPSCVLLLDEIEKADDDIFNMLLQVMDYATLTDNKGQKADFKNAIIIMTSNVGARNLDRRGIGFGSNEYAGADLADKELKKVFSPEFRNRLSKTVKFNRITKELAYKIAEIKLNKLRDKLNEKKVEFSVSDSCKKYIADKAVGIEVGARELDRVIETEIQSLLVDELLFGSLVNGGKVSVVLKDGKPSLRKGK